MEHLSWFLYNMTMLHFINSLFHLHCFPLSQDAQNNFVSTEKNRKNTEYLMSKKEIQK